MSNLFGKNLPPSRPTSPAPMTMTGKGTPRKKIAAKASAEMLHITSFFSAFRAMRIMAAATMAITAAFNP
jgi:hypothetical protein